MLRGSLKTAEALEAVRSKFAGNIYLISLTPFAVTIRLRKKQSCAYKLNPYYCLGQKPVKDVLMPWVFFQDWAWYYQLTFFYLILAVL